jgi:ArsR family transcriptional regulator, lead/cadmium/zinc/bismuth-responsive transcriptional repressor
MPLPTHLTPARPPADSDRCDDFHDAARLESIRPALMAADVVGRMADTFRTLGDPTRVRLLDALARAELCVGDLAALVGLSESAVSHQLRLLRGLRLVRPRRAGRRVFYALDDQHIVRLFEQGLHHVREERPARVAGPVREA